MSDESDSEESSAAIQQSSKKRKRSNKSASSAASKKRFDIIDDSAILSGEEDSGDEEEDDENENEYIKDDFVVDENDVDVIVDPKRRSKKGDLEDSDSDDDDLDDDDDDGERRRDRKNRRVRKLRQEDVLDDDDLALIDEARGINRHPEDFESGVRAATGAELRNELFQGEDHNGAGAGGKFKNRRPPLNKRKPTSKVADFDEHGLDDFIEYDDEGGDMGARERYDDHDEEGGQHVSEAQLRDASDVFGTDFLDMMGGADEDKDNMDGDEYRERGVGVDYGVVGSSDEEDDLFGEDDDEDDDDLDDEDKEAARLRREKRTLEKEERRRQKRVQKQKKQRALLRKTFEPVQLIENFCTDRDDDIRSKDVPERFYERKVPFHGPTLELVTDDISHDEEIQARWIATRIPDIAAEFNAHDIDPVKTENIEAEYEAMEQNQRVILKSIVMALRYMHKDMLEPDFIRIYRADHVTHAIVREQLHKVMEEDVEWDRLKNAKAKVLTLLETISSAVGDVGASVKETTSVLKLKEELRIANERLDANQQEEERLRLEVGELSDDDDDDDDELFGEDDDDEDKKKEKEEKKKQSISLRSHLKATQELVNFAAEKVAQLTTALNAVQEENEALQPGQSGISETSAKISKSQLWNVDNYQEYLAGLAEYQHVMDVYSYLNLLKEGNNAVLIKSSSQSEKETKKRSRRFDRDYYRTCVSQGLRSICYRFALSPFRAGIRVEEGDHFNYEQRIPGEINEPKDWQAPIIEDADPTTFASELVSSGELVLLAENNEKEIKDPLRGCRYVAAMELAYEPRVRKHLRAIYKSRAVFTTLPTNKGLESIDPFHEFYGLHLIKKKNLSDHFPADPREVERQKIGHTMEERKEIDEKNKRKERDSCIQFMNVLKAEQSGHLKAHVHLPLLDNSDDPTDPWYKRGNDFFDDRENQDLSLLMNELQNIYLPINGDSDEWNAERQKIMLFALTNFLLPQFEVEARRELREAAIKVGIDEAGKNLYTMAMEGPYRPSHMLGENRFLVSTGDLPVVGVCCASDGRDASFLAAVTEQGKMSDHLAIPSGIQIDSDKMRDKVITFLMQARPSAIIVGTSAGLSCRFVARKLGELAAQATERWNNKDIQREDEDDDEYQVRKDEFDRLFPKHYEEDSDWKCNVEMVDDDVAQLFGRSVRGKKEFPDSPVNLKCAIAVARHAKDPLAELCYTWSVASDLGVFGTEMLYLNIHSLRLLPKPLLLREYERVLCRAVADVGVDINMACQYDHLRGLLTFVPGLGSRKAAHLKDSLERIGGFISNRNALLGRRLLGPVVYNNAVAFLRIRDTDTFDSKDVLHPLDDTRLHPDVYLLKNWAIKIAKDALEVNDGQNFEADKERDINYLNDIMQDSRNEVHNLYAATKAEWERVNGPTFSVGAWDPRINVPSERWRDKVEELDLEAFAGMIEDNGQGKWLSHLSMIKWEFRLPYEDPRKPMDPLDKEKLFRLLTSENDQTLCPGKEVTGKIVRITDFGAHVKLEGDVPGFIPLRNLADGHVESAEDIVQVGAVVTAIVTEVKKDHMSVDLSMKVEDLRKDSGTWQRPASLPMIDPSFDRYAASLLEKEKIDKREERLAKMKPKTNGDGMDVDSNGATAIGRTGRVTRRACAHPAFRNARNDEIEKELKEGGAAMVGEALVRPSSKAADSLALHWLVREGVTKVVEVAEEDKDNDASIGNTLRIKDETYGSIDELLARYVSPMNDRVEELVHHRKYKNLPEDDLDDQLRAMKKKDPKGSFYFLCWSQKFPGYASLRYVFSQTPRNHYVGINPDGFNWDQRTFKDLDHLLNKFKQHPRGTSQSRSRTSVSTSSSQRPAESRQSRWGPAAPSAPPTAPGGAWSAPPPVPANDVWGRPPPPSLPPPPSYPPIPPPVNPRYSQPLPPSLPPPPQMSYPPMPPPGAPPNYPPQ